MEETLKPRSSIAAPFIFLLTIVLQYISIFLEHHLKKRKSWNSEQMQLRGEIKELLKEAGTLSNPSTFAQAAKLRRMAAAKEKELIKSQEMQLKESKLSYDTYVRVLSISKVVAYLVLIVWFWGDPVAVVSQQLLQPFGRVLSWKAGDPSNDYIKVGVIPWLILSNRVGKFLSQKLPK
ncbi:Tail-anchored protein insertion receptor wrb [Thalictrum thalictroides]|uniref:Tail-anchored protein insertion receptor wrb n=1 Tax=Thalictrum thalictroides TaxID=46969 RepID=A0A7J6VXY9_THATH|nr:Tail-anchored protein insertion receptor wrb [Thalictrum thalictroides]